MKKVSWLSVLAFVQTVRAVTLPFEDHLSYFNGNLFTVGAGVWDAGGSTGPEQIVTNTAALTAPSASAPSCSSAGWLRRWASARSAVLNRQSYSAVNTSTTKEKDQT